jgi:lipid II:glycine glycyltransferase (peptidoglycan interpeptide bridge formation enzyme)
MSVRLAPVQDRMSWNRVAGRLPGSHVLQSWEWGEFKSRYGWSPRRMVWRDEAGQEVAAAQVLERRSGRLARLRVLYCPRGPLVDWSDAELRRVVLTDLASLAREPGTVMLRIDPEIPTACDEGAPPRPSIPGLHDDLARCGWRAGRDQVQFRNTLVLDLDRDEPALLAAMHPKTRYNIRIAQRHGLSVRAGSAADVELLYRMYAETSLRDRFVIREPAYYAALWGDFQAGGRAQLFVAEMQSKAIAGLVLFTFGQTAWYLYGMSTSQHRDTMPNHRLQWEAIRWARAQGLQRYDFWGAPEQLTPSDPMWGVYRFKQGFGPRLQCTLGALDTTHRPALYRAYHTVLPRLLNLLRRRGFSATERTLG